MAFEPQELRKFHDAGKAIAKAANVGLEQWARGVSPVILKDWTEAIKVADTKRIEDRARGRVNIDLGISRKQNPSFGDNPYRVSINTGGKKGRPEVVWTRNPKTKKWAIVGTASGGTFTPAHRHWTDETWALMSAGAQKFAGMAPDMIAKGKRAAGLARQSVVQIADALGFPLASAAANEARGALASDGKPHVNGTGKITKTPETFEIEMVNRYSRNREAKVAEALQFAIGMQLGRYKANAETKVFESVEKTVKAYPYLKTT